MPPEILRSAGVISWIDNYRYCSSISLKILPPEILRSAGVVSWIDNYRYWSFSDISFFGVFWSWRNAGKFLHSGFICFGEIKKFLGKWRYFWGNQENFGEIKKFLGAKKTLSAIVFIIYFYSQKSVKFNIFKTILHTKLAFIILSKRRNRSVILCQSTQYSSLIYLFKYVNC